MKLRRFMWVATLTLGLGAFQNCAKAHFSSDGEDSSAAELNDGNNGATGQTASGGSTCTQVLNTTTTPTRLLFVVDESGSNKTAPNVGTDPNKTFRGGSIQAFFNDYSAKAAFGWGFIGFQGTTATSFIRVNNAPAISTNATDMQNAINHFEAVADGDSTPYQAALSAVASLIGSDSGTADTNYLVIFLSDGVPNPAVSDTALASDIARILALRPDHVTLSTIYYGPTNADASGRLRMMASLGQGHFLDTNSDPTDKDFAISNVVSVPGTNCSSN